LNSSELEASVEEGDGSPNFLATTSCASCIEFFPGVLFAFSSNLQLFVGYLALSLSQFLWVFVFAQSSDTLISLVAIATKVLILVK
jgi:hypothetical protein